MAGNKTLNTFEGGLIKNNNPTKQPKNSYTFALNAVINNIVTDNTSITNEKNFRDYFTVSVKEAVVLGWCWLGNEEYVLFIKNKQGVTAFNQIIYINPPKAEKRVLYDNLKLNFQDDYEIKTTYRINYKNQRIVYFVDGLNDDRIINVEVDSKDLDISLMSLAADYIKPSVGLVVQDTGGNITTGQYFVAMSYNLGESFTTSPLSISRPVSIASEKYYKLGILGTSIDHAVNKQFGDTDGDIIPIPTPKSISILLENLDPKYTSYNLYIIKPSSTGTYTIKTIKDISITTDSFQYTGGEGEIDDSITINGIIVDTIKYYASEAITQKDNRLIRGNSKLKRSAVDYQQFANQIKVSYSVTDELVYQDSLYIPIEYNNGDRDPNLSGDMIFKEHSTSPSYLSYTAAPYGLNTKGFTRDGVYALGVSIEFLDGSESAVFHVPGRAVNTVTANGLGEYGRSNYAQIDTEKIEGIPYWQARNTALNNGQLAYWRSNLTYTDGFGFPTDGEKDTNGRSFIRHHRMPSDVLEPLFRTEVIGNPNAGRTNTEYKIYKRNLRLNFDNIIIPEELADQISNIKIHYTPRTQENKNILSKGIMYGLNETASVIRQPTHANFGFNDTKGASKFEFISPDVNFNFKQSTILGSKLKVNSVYKGNLQYVGAKMKIGSTETVAHTQWFNNKAFNDTARLQAVTVAAVPYLLSNPPRADQYVRDLKKAVYVDANFKGSTEGFNLDFSGGEKTSVLEVAAPIYFTPVGSTAKLNFQYPFLYYPSTDNPTNLNGYFGISRGSLGNNPDFQNQVYYDTVYYVSIMNDNGSLYGKPEDLKYVELATVRNMSGVDITYAYNVAGDTFVDMHHFKKKYAATTAQDFTTFDTEATQIEKQFTKVGEIGIVTFGSFMCETDINIRMRREGEGEAERYFPKSYYGAHTVRDYSQAAINEEYYKIEEPYNTQYIKYNFANNIKLTDFAQEDVDIRYSTRIIYSEKQELEDKGDFFRTVKANNYRDLPLNRGPISLFFTKRDKLYTITRDSLFDVFASNQTIRSENADNIVVGTGEFLSIEPVELVSIDGGFGGSSSKFSLVESPFGHLFVDRKKNKCLMFTDQLKDININGLDESFELELYKQFPTFEPANQFDNPSGLVGIIAIYDPRLQRIIITKKDYKVLDTTGVTVVNGKLMKAGVALDLKNPTIAENKSFTVSYSPIRERWISYHSYIPKLYLPHPTDYIKFDTKLDISNGDGYQPIFTMETVFNDHPDHTKVFDSIQVNLESFNGNVRTNDFFNELLVYNEQQSSGVITLNKTNTTKKEKDWNINKFLDKVPFAANKQLFSTNWADKKLNYYVDKVVHPLVQTSTKPWYQMGRFRDKYLISRFTYKNLEMKKIIVNFVNSTYRVSTR
jgi:hypothetical protein